MARKRRKNGSEKRCKLHPGEQLTVVTHTVTRYGVLIVSETLYICEKCPAYLTESQTKVGELHQQLELL